MDMTSDSINVTYKFVDGAHFFVPADKKAMGLCVANADLEIAYGEVSEQLSKIVAFNTGKTAVQYVPAVPIEEFKKIVTAFAAIAEMISGHAITSNTTQVWMNTASSDKRLELA